MTYENVGVTFVMHQLRLNNKIWRENISMCKDLIHHVLYSFDFFTFVSEQTYVDAILLTKQTNFDTIEHTFDTILLAWNYFLI